MTQKLLCVSVDELTELKASNREHWVKSPTLCSALISEELLQDVEKGQAILSEHHINEVVITVQYLNWFYSLNKRVFQTVTSYLHVRQNEIYFSGALYPQTNAAFRSHCIPITEVTDQAIIPIKVDYSLLDTVSAKRIIIEIQRIEEEYSAVCDRRDSLDTLSDSLEAITPSPISDIENESDHHLRALSQDILRLDSQAEKLEATLNIKCIELCTSVLGIKPGDRIYTRQYASDVKRQIILEQVRYYNGTLYLDGPKVLQNGSIGKRTETCCIEVESADER